MCQRYGVCRLFCRLSSVVYGVPGRAEDESHLILTTGNPRKMPRCVHGRQTLLVGKQKQQKQPRNAGNKESRYDSARSDSGNTADPRSQQTVIPADSRYRLLVCYNVSIEAGRNRVGMVYLRLHKRLQAIRHPLLLCTEEVVRECCQPPV